MVPWGSEPGVNQPNREPFRMVRVDVLDIEAGLTFIGELLRELDEHVDLFHQSVFLFKR